MKEKKLLKRVLIMAAGTGGHVFPGLAVAQYLKEQGVEVHWLGTPQGMESRIVPEAGIPFHSIDIGGLRGKGMKTLITAPFRVMRAVGEVSRLIKQLKPQVVLGMGGYVTGPGGLASWMSGCPLVIHEQNAKAGLTNKLLSAIATKVLEGVPGVFPSSAKVIAVGNPVRSTLETLPSPEARLLPRTPYRMLVLGGSLGAQALNKVMPEALLLIDEEDRPLIRHQTGEKHFEETKKDYASKHIDATVEPFIEDMAEAYMWADIVLCRAGALTIAELAAVGLGAVLVPYPYAVDDHQTANAKFMVEHGAALCIPQSELTDGALAAIIEKFGHSDKRIAMARAAYELRKTAVTKKIFDILSESV